MATAAGVIEVGSANWVHKGYKVMARHKVDGPLPLDDELAFELTPP